MVVAWIFLFSLFFFLLFLSSRMLLFLSDACWCLGLCLGLCLELCSMTMDGWHWFGMWPWGWTTHLFSLRGCVPTRSSIRHASQQQLVHVVVRARVGVVDDLDPNPRACSQRKVRRVQPCERRWKTTWKERMYTKAWDTSHTCHVHREDHEWDGRRRDGTRQRQQDVVVDVRGSKLTW